MSHYKPRKCVHHQRSVLFGHCYSMSERQCCGGGSVSFRGMFVPSNADLWDRLDALFLNELWIIGLRDDFLLRLAKYYYMVWSLNLIAGQNVSSRPRHFNPIHWNNQYQVLYLWPLIQNTEKERVFGVGETVTLSSSAPTEFMFDVLEQNNLQNI